MTNEEKARELSRFASGDIDIMRYDTAMDMAEWKDEQTLEFLRSLIFQATPESLNTMINNKIKELSYDNR